MGDMFDGTTTSDCALPCETISTQTKKETEYKAPFTQLEISFSSKVRITTTDLLQPTTSIFLSEVTGDVWTKIILTLNETLKTTIN